MFNLELENKILDLERRIINELNNISQFLEENQVLLVEEKSCKNRDVRFDQKFSEEIRESNKIFNKLKNTNLEEKLYFEKLKFIYGCVGWDYFLKNLIPDFYDSNRIIIKKIAEKKKEKIKKDCKIKLKNHLNDLDFYDVNKMINLEKILCENIIEKNREKIEKIEEELLLTEKIEIFKKRYEVYEFKYPLSILRENFKEELNEILEILNNFELLASDILKPGGRKTVIAEKLDSAFYKKDWKEVEFDTKISLQKKEYAKSKSKIVGDVEEYETPTHKIDCFKNRIAFEIEWNNKTEFFDRDLNNFRLLFDLNVISVGVIITRTTELDRIFKQLEDKFKEKYPKSKSKLIEKYGSSSTHMNKLIPRIEGRSGGGCPLLIIGICEKTYKNDL